jgi:hypothetical protein
MVDLLRSAPRVFLRRTFQYASEFTRRAPCISTILSDLQAARRQ